MTTNKYKQTIKDAEDFMSKPRFKGIKRLYSARQVAEQQGSIYNDYSIAKSTAASFYERLRELQTQQKQITTFGPYSPSQAVMMKRKGIEGIYLGGWATSAKGSMDEDPGADLASYPLSQVPNEAASIVRALLAADKNQQFQRYKMTAEERLAIPEFDYRPFIIADADTGHGGDAHVRNLIRRFVEAGVPGYHIEDQKPGTKKCGHQGGKVLVSCDEQIKRVNAARFQLDTMRVEGLIVARTDAEAATLLENMADERDHPFILGATNLNIPAYKHAFLALQKALHELGAKSVRGHELYEIGQDDQVAAVRWLQEVGVLDLAGNKIDQLLSDDAEKFEPAFDEVLGHFVKVWENAALIKTYGECVAEHLEWGIQTGIEYDMNADEWRQFASKVSLKSAERKAFELGIEVAWDCDLAKTPEGYYQVKGGIPYAITKSLAVAPYADLLWMETKTADLDDARQFAEAIHQVYPDKMLVYNLSPSFNWDTTGMSEEEMMHFSRELGKMGFVFNFITYVGHQIDGLAAEEFADALQTEGMLALAKVQRKLRLYNSPYKTPQSHVGGPRLDSALGASSGRTATTKAMGKGSTQFQHLVQTELPVSLLSDWINIWSAHYQLSDRPQVVLKPYRSNTSLLVLELRINEQIMANVIFTNIVDRKNKKILSIRDQNTFEADWRQKRLMTLLHLFLVNRFSADEVHYLTPTSDNVKQCAGMQGLNIYLEFNEQLGQIIVANVDKTEIKGYLKDEQKVIDLIQKKQTQTISV